MIRDCIVIGSGIAGMTAAIYLARAGHRPVCTHSYEVQENTSSVPLVENFPGFMGTGQELFDRVSEQCASLGVEFDDSLVTDLDLEKKTMRTEDGRLFRYSAVVVASGCSPRRIYDGVDKHLGNGLSYCSVCDGAMSSGMNVVVVGAGNSAFSEAMYLSSVAESVTILHRHAVKAEKSIVDAAMSRGNVFLRSGEVESISGELGCMDIRLTDGETVSCVMVFSAIGGVPNTSFISPKRALDAGGSIRCIDGCICDSSGSVFDGAFCAGDCCESIRQLAVAAGSGCRAAIRAVSLLNSKAGHR